MFVAMGHGSDLSSKVCRPGRQVVHLVGLQADLRKRASKVKQWLGKNRTTGLFEYAATRPKHWWLPLLQCATSHVTFSPKFTRLFTELAVHLKLGVHQADTPKLLFIERSEVLHFHKGPVLGQMCVRHITNRFRKRKKWKRKEAQAAFEPRNKRSWGRRSTAVQLPKFLELAFSKSFEGGGGVEPRSSVFVSFRIPPHLNSRPSKRDLNGLSLIR